MTSDISWLILQINTKSNCTNINRHRLRWPDSIKSVSGIPGAIHFDQGCQFTSYVWDNFCEYHKQYSSMSRKDDCRDNAVVESFFSSLKKERNKKRIYKNREEARKDVFSNIELFYNSKRRYSHLNH